MLLSIELLLRHSLEDFISRRKGRVWNMLKRKIEFYMVARVQQSSMLPGIHMLLNIL